MSLNRCFITWRQNRNKIENDFVHASIVDRCRAALLGELKNMPQGITIAQFRDLIQGNRKMCLLLLSRFDNEEIIIREGDVRLITDKGREYAG